MRYFDWDEEKNRRLKKERSVGFEEVQLAVKEGRMLDAFDHPNQKRYPNQKIMVVEISDYVHLVPYVKEGSRIFLYTIIPSRKATRKYLRSK